MKKLTLNLDELCVESFDASSGTAGAGRGTVEAHESEDTMELKCWNLPQVTWGQSCMIGTCGASCDSCNYTCGGTCDYTCGCNFTDLCSANC